MQKIKKTVFCLIFTFQSFSFIYADIKVSKDAEYVKTLNTLFSVSGNTELYSVAVKQMLALLREQHPDIEEEKWEALEKEFTNILLDELTAMLAPAYKKYFTLEDLKEIIKFYNTPVGRKYSRNLPQLTQDTTLIGTEWGRKVGQKISERIDDIE